MAQLDERASAPAAPRRNVLLMTATIAPAAQMANTARANPDLRRKDYEDALAGYLAMPAGTLDEVLFCENSGVDLGSIERVAAERNPHGVKLRCLSFTSDCPPDEGKGFAELDILDRAYDAFIADAGEGDVFWKVTGRLLVTNLPQMIATAPHPFGIYADFRSVPMIGERLGGNNWTDTRFLAFTRDGYAAYLKGANAWAGWTIEKGIFETLSKRLSEEPVIRPRFTRQPVISGVCAGSTSDYDGFGYKAKNALRRAARAAAPGLWL